MPIELPMKSPLLPNLIWVKMCDWYHRLRNQKLISTFNTLRVAQNLRWPIDQLLQSVLKGKAQETYTALAISDYNCVKNAILNAYELVPEAYHQKFRNYYKQESQTHVEFAHEKEGTKGKI